MRQAVSFDLGIGRDLARSKSKQEVAMMRRAAVPGVILALALLVPPVSSDAQQPGKVYRIGWIGFDQ